MLVKEIPRWDRVDNSPEQWMFFPVIGSAMLWIPVGLNIHGQSWQTKPFFVNKNMSLLNEFPLQYISLLMSHDWFMYYLGADKKKQVGNFPEYCE